MPSPPMPRSRSRLLVALFAAAALIALSGCSAGVKQSPAAAPSGANPASGTPATSADVVSLVSQAAAIKGLPSDLRPDLQSAANDSGQVTAAKVGCNPDQKVVTTPDCYFGDVQGTRTLVLYGDSHAVMWMPAFDAIGKRLHWRIALLGKFACSAPDLSYYDGEGNRHNSECDAWHPYAMARAKALKPDVIVFSSEYATPYSDKSHEIDPASWQAGLVKTLAQAASPTTKLVVLGDIPYLTQSGPDCLAAHGNQVQACSTDPAKAVYGSHIEAEKAAAAQGGATYVPVLPWFCGQTCPAVIGSYEVYSDRFHVTQTYVDYLSGALQGALAPLLR